MNPHDATNRHDGPEPHPGSADNADLPATIKSALASQYQTWRALRLQDRLVAVLTSMRWEQQQSSPPVGARSVRQSPARRVIGTSADLEVVIDLLEARTPHHVHVIGHIVSLSNDASVPSAVEFWAGPDQIRQAPVYPTGEFECRDVPAGDYSLLLVQRERSLLLAPTPLSLEN